MYKLCNKVFKTPHKTLIHNNPYKKNICYNRSNCTCQDIITEYHKFKDPMSIQLNEKKCYFESNKYNSEFNKIINTIEKNTSLIMQLVTKYPEINRKRNEILKEQTINSLHIIKNSFFSFMDYITIFVVIISLCGIIGILLGY